MTQAYLYGHLRTPRGKGKKDGRLNPATPIWLLRTLLRALQARLNLDTALVDDVVLGCVTPVGEQGGDIARFAVLDAGWAQSVAGQTLNRFCASGLEAVNLAAAKVMSGMEDLVVAGGVESMSRVAMGSDGGAWLQDPRVIDALALVPQHRRRAALPRPSCRCWARPVSCCWIRTKPYARPPRWIRWPRSSPRSR